MGIDKKVVAIIQARTGSTRLPKKVLLPLPIASESQNVLYHVCKRAKLAAGVDQVVLATTIKPADEAISDWASKNNIDFYRGSEDDVLDRYYQAALQYGADIVVRITADCPCIDSDIISEIVTLMRIIDADYISNTHKRTYPHGMDCEVFTFAALEKAWKEATEMYDREHVTPYIYKSGLFKCVDFEDPNGADDTPSIRVTLDTPEDYTAICAVYDLLGERFSSADIVNLYRKYLWLRWINR
jgi:spore coat polysaccharide biosynthesis protein SpsF